ncbi:transcription antitermination factor NusB [Facklamia hominis]
MARLSRRIIREKAIQTLYPLSDSQVNFDLDQSLRFALEAGNDPEEGWSMEEVDPYLSQLVAGVVEHYQELDSEIAHYLSGEWTLDRIARIDLTILRLAFYELIDVCPKDPDLVPSVVADEAIELAKTFSDDRSRKFISGVLAHYIQNNC